MLDWGAASHYCGRLVPAFPAVRVIFCWAYRLEPEGWRSKEDSTQYLIRELAKVHDVFVTVLGLRMDSWNYGNAKYISCVDVESLLAVSLALGHAHRGDVAYVLNSQLAFDRAMVKARPNRPPYKTALLAYCHGAKPVAWHGAVDGHLVPTERQMVMNRQLGDVTPHFILPHSPDLETFVPDNGQKKWDVIYPARRDKTKRVELLEQACEIGGFDLRVLDDSMKKDPANRGRRPVPAGQMHRAYQQARVLASTSRSEGGSRVLVEAMSCNVPCVVCADCASNVEYVRRFGGYVVEPDPQAVARGIREALEAPAPDARSRLLAEGVYYQATYAQFRRILRKVLA